MTLNGRQVRQLRAMANTLKANLIIGKAGVTSATAKQASDELEAHELMKCSVLDGAPLATRETAQELAERVEAEVVQVIGRKFVLYRPTSREDVERIELVP